MKRRSCLHLAESDCAEELELIRYTACTSAISFADSAAAAISWERPLSLAAIWPVLTPPPHWRQRGLLEKSTRLPSTPALREHLWRSSRPNEVADSTNKSYVGQELTASPIGMPCPDPLRRWCRFARRFPSRRPLLRRSDDPTDSLKRRVHFLRCGTVQPSNPQA